MKKILLIEDDEDTREECRHILTLANYNVLTAANGKIGVEMATEHLPDLIICDIMMPILDGYGVFHLIQKNSHLQDIPFIFLTGMASHNDMRRAMDLGADDYILKPLNGSELLNSVECRLRKKEHYAYVDAHDDEMYDEQCQSPCESTLKAFIQNRNIEILGPKQLIYQEGKRPVKMFYILKGKVRTYLRNNYGKELVSDLYNAGDFFGYTALLENSNYKEFAETIDYTELVVIPVGDFETLIYQNRQIAKQFFRLLAQNIADKEQQLIKMAYASLRRKVAEALITLQRKYRSLFDEPFTIKLSRESLASIAGTATESLIRTLSDFRNEKLIEMGPNGSIRIINPAKLESIID